MALNPQSNAQAPMMDIEHEDDIDARIEENYGARGLHILRERYTRRGETPAQAMWRVCRCVAAGQTGESTPDTEKIARGYMDKLLVSNRFLPNTPTWTGAGVGKGQLAACFVLPIEDTMESIFGTLRDAALIQSTGGGTGFTFGHLRPAGSLVQSSQGSSSGAISFIEAYDAVFNAVQQGGGANMAMMPVSHPDIFSFIRCKQIEGKITNFNLSVSAPDSFMAAVEEDKNWPLVDPSTGGPAGLVSATALFGEIAEGGRRNGEPGMVFIDAVNRDNPCPGLFTIEATNPCVPGDTVVNTSRGPMPVKYLLGTDFETPDGIAVPGGFYKTKTVDSLVRVTTSLGFSILCTPEHRLMTISGWKQASALKSGEDSLVIKAGTYKTSDTNPEETPHREWSREAAPLIVGGASETDFESSAFLALIDCATFKGAVGLVREAWFASGSPHWKMVFKTPVYSKLVSAFQLALLRLGIVSSVVNGDAEVDLVPTPDCESAFRDVMTAGSGEIAFRVVWGRLHIREVNDVVKSVESTSERGAEDVYDATCDPTANKPILWTGAFLSHNCSEVPLSSYESCCLGSINLKTHVSSDGHVNWPALEETVHTGVHFLTNVIMANKFVPAVPQLMQKARTTMRIGLGVMGLADMLFSLRIRYGSPESISVASQVMEFVRYHAMLASMHLAVAQGTFPAFSRSTYASGRWQPPTPLDAKTLFGVDVPEVDLRRPTNISWGWLRESIMRVGVRNITTTAVAPTGTLSLVAGVSGFGCEPVFALSHRRRILGLDGSVRYEHMLVPELTEAIERCPELKSDPEKKSRVMAEILRTGNCAGMAEVPKSISDVFVCASDISVREHVMMQAALQRFVDGAISKTINLPPGSNVEDIKSALRLAWKAGCKGICVYVAGSRQVEVLTAGTK